MGNIIILSDIHIGTNTPTVWYQKDFHEPYLLSIFNYILKNAASIQQLVLLGDIVDYWTYPPNVRPPSFQEIIDANPDILGPGGGLCQVLDALKGNVCYIRGNHDMTVTQDDLNRIRSPGGHTITLSKDWVYKPGPDVTCSHGHINTMFNAPDENTPLKPLPVGHFVTRAVAHMMSKQLKPGQTVADLPNQGSPNGVNLDGLIAIFQNDFPDISIADILLDYICKVTGLSETEEIIMADGSIETIIQAKKYYKSLWTNWVNSHGGGTIGQLSAFKSAVADADGTYMGWFAQKLAFETDSTIAFGHTHFPLSGLKNSIADYVNSGFECPSKPDISSHEKSITFVEMDSNGSNIKVLQVEKEGASYNIKNFPTNPALIVVPPSQDFSTYVILDNTHGTSPLLRKSFKANEGYYVVEPPQQVPPGEIRSFWIQDYPLFLKPEKNSSDGEVVYSRGDSRITLKFADPFYFWNSNKASGAPFYSKSGNDKKWGKLNEVKKSGHPFFVKFLLKDG